MSCTAPTPREWFPTVARLLPGRPTTAEESAGVLRLAAACLEAGVGAGPFIESWSHSLPRRVRRRVARFGAAIAGGEPLLVAARKVPGVVHPDHATALRFGELAGLVPQSLRAAADATDAADESATGRTRAALGYVAVVSVVFLLMMTFFSIKVMPAFQKIFDDFGMKTPVPLDLAIALCRVCAVVLPVVLVGVPLVILGRWLLFCFRRGRHSRRTGVATRRAGWLDMLAAGIRGGLPADVAVARLVESIEPRTGDAVALARATAAGGSLGTQLAAAGIVSPAEATLVDAGARSGEADLVLGWLGDERRAERSRRLSAWSEALVPIAAVMLGGLVFVQSLGVYAVLSGLVEALS